MTDTKIDMKPVTSSNIAALGYDSESKTLAVQFITGSEYRYHNVSQETYDALLGAQSIGKHFVGNIVGKFRHTKVS